MADAQRFADGGPCPGGLAATEAWLGARRGLVLALVVVVATVARVATWQQLSRSPIAWAHEWVESDMNFFHTWAQVVAGGDVLTDGALHPYHGWHADVAALHFDDHPEDEQALAAAARATGDERPPGHLLWDRWFGGPRFHQEPLYAYLIALTYLVAGPDVLAVFGWQMLLGVGTVVLLWWLARRLGGELAGLIAGLLAGVYGPLLLYEMTLLRTSPLAFAGVGLTALLATSTERPTARRWALVGAACGVAVLLKTTFLLFLLAAVSWPLLALRRRPERSVRLAGAVVGGAALVFSLAVGRNLAVGAPATSLTSVLPLNAILSWSPGAHVRLDGFAPNLLDLARIFGETDGRTGPVLAETLLAPDERGARLTACAQRFTNAFHAFESPNNVNIHYARLHAPLLAAVGFGHLGPLALVGLALVACRWRRGAREAAGPTWPLLLLVVATLLPLVLFGTLARYRLLMAMALIPFAACVPVALLERLATRRWSGAAALLALLLASGAWIHRPLPEDVTPVRPVDWVMPYQVFYGPLAAHAVASGDPLGAAELLADALHHQPDEVTALGPGRPAEALGQAQLARDFAGYHRSLAECWELAGQGARARAAHRRADELIDAAAMP